MRTILLEVSPLQNGVPVTLRTCGSASSSATTQLNGYQWLPCITKRHSRSANWAKDGILSPIDTSWGSIEFWLNKNFNNESWTAYEWSGALARIFVGEEGAAFGTYEQVFEGKVSSLDRTGNRATIALLGAEADLVIPLLSATYGGTGGADGSPSIKGTYKPRAFGSCQSVAPVLVDGAKLIYQVHGYGAVASIPRVYEFGQALDAAKNKGDVATYADLAALTLVPSEWATCTAQGMFRLGGQPTQKVSADVVAGSTDVASIARQLLAIAGVPDAKMGNLSIFATTNWNLYLTDQAEVLDTLRGLLFDAGGYIIPDGTGKWYVGDYYAPKVATVLNEDRTSFPMVRSIKELNANGPIYKASIGHSRCWNVHSESEVSPALSVISDQQIADREAAAAALEAAEQAAADAQIAKDRSDAISNDGILDRSEKAQLVQTFSAESAQQSGLQNQTTNANVTAERNTLATAFANWKTYLEGLNPAYTDTTRDTPIDRATFDARQGAYWIAKQNLTNAYGGKASTVSTWAGVSGAGKPADNADVTSQNTAKDTAAVAGTPAATLVSTANSAKTVADAQKSRVDTILDATLPGINSTIASNLQTGRDELAAAKSTLNTDIAAAKKEGTDAKTALADEVTRAKGREDAINTSVVNLKTTVDGHTTTISDNYTTLNDKATSLANRASALEGIVNSGTDGNAALKARIAAEETARSNAYDAIVTRTSTLETQYGGVVQLFENDYFDNGGEGWTGFPSSQIVASSAGRRNVLRTLPSQKLNGIEGRRISIIGTSQKFKLKISFRCAQATAFYYFGAVYYDANNNIVQASDGTGNYPLGAGFRVDAATNSGWIEREVIIGKAITAPSPYTGTTTIPAGAVYFRPIMFLNYLDDAGSVTEVDYFAVEDVTAVEVANARISAEETARADAVSSLTTKSSSLEAKFNTAGERRTTTVAADTFVPSSQGNPGTLPNAGSFGQTTGYGPYVELGIANATLRSVVPMARAASQTFKLRARLWQIAAGPTAAIWYVEYLDANFNMVSTSTIGGWHNINDGSFQTIDREYTATFVEGVVWMRFSVLINRKQTNPGGETVAGAVTRVFEASIENITSIKQFDTATNARIAAEEKARADQVAALTTRTSSLETSFARVPETWRVKARGNGAPAPANFGDNGVFAPDGRQWGSYQRSYVVVYFKDGVNEVQDARAFDVYNNGEIKYNGSDPAVNNSQGMANYLNGIPAGRTVIVYTSDEPASMRHQNGLLDAMRRCGAGEMFESIRFRSHSAYVLLGKAGVGRGGGDERYAGNVDVDSMAWLDVSFTMVNGRIALGGQAAAAATSARLDEEASARSAADSALVTRSSNLESQMAGTAASGLQTLIKNNRQNLIDVGWWKKGASIPWGLNGGQRNEIVEFPHGSNFGGVGMPDGSSGDAWLCMGGADAAGGWNAGPIAPLDPDKTYRFTVPINTLHPVGARQSYWGTGGVCALNTATEQVNPYFAYGGVTPGKWYLFVGYIFPRNSTGKNHDGAGAYDMQTGEKVLNGTNFCFHPDGRQPIHRAYQYYASEGSYQAFGRPMVELIDGTETPFFSNLGAIRTTNARVSAEESARASADSALATRATALEASATNSGNLVPNTAFQTLDGWQLTNNPRGGYHTLNLAGAPYMIGGTENNMTLFQGAGAGGLQMEAQSAKFALRGGAYYQVQALTASHRCQAWVSLFFFNGADQFLGYAGENFGARINAGGQDINQHDITGNMCAQAPAGTVYGRLVVRMYDVSADGYVWISRPYVGEVKANTNQWNAYTPGNDRLAIVATNARIATEESARANADSALANRASTLEASVIAANGSVLTANPNFAYWTNVNGLPDGWIWWVANGSVSRYATVNASRGYAFRHNCPAGVEAGIYQPGTRIHPGWYVMEADIELLDGSLQGAGLTISGVYNMNFATEADVNGDVGPGGFRRRRFSKLVKIEQTLDNWHPMTNWTGFGGLAYKYVDWYYAGVRPATDGEIKAQKVIDANLIARVTTTESVLASAGNLAARWKLVAQTPGANAFITAEAVTSNGVAVSNVSIGGTAVNLVNTDGSGARKALTVENGVVTVYGALRAGASITLGSGTGWPVALASKDFSVSNGEYVGFGTTLDSLPNLSFAGNGLVALNSGETYRLYAENLTRDGFTARLEISTPAQPTSYDLQSGQYNGSGLRVIDKYPRGDSTSNAYNVTVTGYITATAYNNGDTYCIWTEAYTYTGKKGYELEAGDLLMVMEDDGSYAPAPIEEIGFNKEHCILLRSASGIELTVSRSTPVTLRDGTSIKATEVQGHELPVLDGDDFRWEEIVAVEDAGERPVARIYVGDKTFAAGNVKGRSIFTHNLPVNKQ